MGQQKGLPPTSNACSSALVIGESAAPQRLQQRLGDRRVRRPVNASRTVLLLIRRVRPSGEEEPADDGQDDDDAGDTRGPTAGLPASTAPTRMLYTYRPLHRARQRLAIRQRLRKRSTKTI